MALKYTILKVYLQIFTQHRKSSRGFTLLELIAGLSIMLIVGGVAMNAFIGASTSFNKDKRSIEANQNMSAVLEIIGNDIKQAGENISDNNFPTVEFIANTDSGSMPNSSKIIVRRALTGQLTVCEPAFNPATATSIIVADNLAATVNAPGGTNCDVGTASSPLSVYRVPTTVAAPAPPTTVPATLSPTIATYYPQDPAIFNPYPTAPTPLLRKLPVALRQVRDYRCNTDPNTDYDSAANAGVDFCASVPNAKLRIAVANSEGKLVVFNQTDEVVLAQADTTVKLVTDTTSTKRYGITLENILPTDGAFANNTKNSAITVTYPIGSPIYVIEERVYALTSGGEFKLSVNGRPAQTLIKKIENFRVSAKIYDDPIKQTVKDVPIANICADVSPFAPQPTSPTIGPKYICKFNYFTGVTTTDKDNWKTLAGIQVELKAKYDSSGGAATASTTDAEKLYTKAEFFPRNVLSR